MWEWSFWAFFCGHNGKTLTVCNQWTRWNSPSKKGSCSATVSTGCDKQVCIHSTLWRQHYITTSKEYLTNSHIMSKYLGLVFLQLHLVKISSKSIIIWVNYERNKWGAIFHETLCVRNQQHQTTEVVTTWKIKQNVLHKMLQNILRIEDRWWIHAKHFMHKCWLFLFMYLQ